MFRIFRNTFNHNFKLEFGKEDLKVLPLTWKNLSIVASDNAKELTHKLLPPSAAIDWLTDLENFISSQLA